MPPPPLTLSVSVYVVSVSVSVYVVLCSTLVRPHAAARPGPLAMNVLYIAVYIALYILVLHTYSSIYSCLTCRLSSCPPGYTCILYSYIYVHSSVYSCLAHVPPQAATRPPAPLAIHVLYIATYMYIALYILVLHTCRRRPPPVLAPRLTDTAAAARGSRSRSCRRRRRRRRRRFLFRPGHPAKD
jgi:hypothetical protein